MTKNKLKQMVRKVLLEKLVKQLEIHGKLIKRNLILEEFNESVVTEQYLISTNMQQKIILSLLNHQIHSLVVIF